MAREQAQQFLAGETGGAGDRDPRHRRALRSIVGCTGLHNCMHQKE
jgi:hypothetical protein